ncbi:MAG: dTMP kinase [Bacteroidales bacterium]
MKLFVIEGVDGSGKSTQLKLLNKYFVGMGYSCEFLHFPRTDSPYFGELIARFLRGEFGSIVDVDPYLVAMLYAGDRRDASGMIKSWLDEGRIVLLDRYTYSNIAYQCAKLDDFESQERLMNWILALEFSHFGIPKPDLNIFLDVPFSFTEKKLLKGRTGKDREYLKGTRDIHEESLLFQKRVRDIYVRVALEDESHVIIDCRNDDDRMLAPEVISSLIIESINEKKMI